MLLVQTLCNVFVHEYKFLQNNQEYLRYTHESEQIDIHLINHSELDARVSTDLDDISPGKPLMRYRYKKNQ